MDNLGFANLDVFQVCWTELPLSPASLIKNHGGIMGTDIPQIQKVLGWWRPSSRSRNILLFFEKRPQLSKKNSNVRCWKILRCSCRHAQISQRTIGFPLKFTADHNFRLNMSSWITISTKKMTPETPRDYRNLHGLAWINTVFHQHVSPWLFSAVILNKANFQLCGLQCPELPSHMWVEGHTTLVDAAHGAAQKGEGRKERTDLKQAPKLSLLLLLFLRL